MPDESPPQQPPVINPLFAALGLEPVNAQRAAELQQKYEGDLNKTRGALSTANTNREDIQTRNLRAIDESIEGLKNSRYTGAVALNPAVSAAMAAGFLKTTPGVASNFSNELGNAMGNAAPVIGNLEKSGRDSFALLAELQRKRGEYEAEPTKELQAELRAREKSELQNIREVEKASLRAPAGAPTAKTAVDIENLIQDVFKDAEPQVKQETEDKQDANGNPLTVEQKTLIRNYIYAERIRRHNLGKTPESPLYIPPDKSPITPEQKAKAEALMNGLVPIRKGTDKMYDDYVKGFRSQSRNDGQEPLTRENWEIKNRTDATFQTEQAKTDSERYSKGTPAIRTAQQTLDHVERMINHPGMEKVITPNPIMKGMPNFTPAADDFASMHETLQSKLFLSSVELMKGTGPLSNAEGDKVQAAVAALKNVRNPEVYRERLREIQASLVSLQDAVRKDMAAIEARRGISAGGGGGPNNTPPPAEEGTVIRKKNAQGDTTTHTFTNGQWVPPLPGQ